MKIFCPMSIRGGRSNLDNCKFIVDYLIRKGHDVLNKHVVADNVFKRESKLSPKEIHDGDKKWLEEADLVIAEVTNPSLGSGIEIGYAIMLNKKVYALYLKDFEDNISMMVRGNDAITICPYSNKDDLKQILDGIMG